MGAPERKMLTTTTGFESEEEDKLFRKHNKERLHRLWTFRDLILQDEVRGCSRTETSEIFHDVHEDQAIVKPLEEDGKSWTTHPFEPVEGVYSAPGQQKLVEVLVKKLQREGVRQQNHVETCRIRTRFRPSGIQKPIKSDADDVLMLLAEKLPHADTSRLYFVDAVDEDFQTNDVGLRFLHLSRWYDDLADVTFFTHADWREHTVYDTTNSILRALDSSLEWR